MTDRVSLVTGGTGALGRAVVERLVARGDAVVVPVHETPAEELRDVVSVMADVTDPDALERLVSQVREEHGRLDVVCNLVGGFAMASVEDTDPATWDRMLSLNARSAFLTVRASLPLLRRSPAGRILNVASLPAVEGGAARMTAYAAAKAAVANLTRSLAKELGPSITVNAVAPSTLDTEANRRAMPDADRSGWLGTDEVAAVVDFLTGPEAGIVTGNVVRLRR